MENGSDARLNYLEDAKSMQIGKCRAVTYRGPIIKRKATTAIKT